MSKKKPLARKNIFMAQQIAKWYEKQSEETGMSQSNLMVLALHKFMTEQEALNAMKNYEGIMQKIEELEKKVEKTPQSQ